MYLCCLLFGRSLYLLLFRSLFLFLCLCMSAFKIYVHWWSDCAWVSTHPHHRGLFATLFQLLFLLAALVETWESSFLQINQKEQSIGFLYDLPLNYVVWFFNLVSSNLVPNSLFWSSHFICSSILVSFERIVFYCLRPGASIDQFAGYIIQLNSTSESSQDLFDCSVLYLLYMIFLGDTTKFLHYPRVALSRIPWFLITWN